MIISCVSDFDRALAEAKKAILKGGVIVYPTDTLYGIGCDATNAKAVKKVYEIKKRGEDAPLSVLMPDLKMIRDYCIVRSSDEVYLHEHLPGPYTFILRCREGKEIPASRNGKLGVRVPNHFFCITLSRQCGVPIVSTSANISGKNPAKEIGGVDKEVLKGVAVAIDGGACKYGKPSTVVDLIDSKVVRAGAEEMNNEF